MNSKQLECFVEVAESLSFTTASVNLFLSQPSVTHQIKSLEEELGIILFIRTKKSVSLTPAGENFYTDAKEILSRMLIAKNNVQNSIQKYTEKIAIGYSGTALEKTLLPAILNRFSEKYPNVYIFLKKLHYKDLISHLKDKKMDVIFTYTKDSIKQNDSMFFPLVKSGYYALMPKNHPLVQKPVLHIEDLKETMVILPEVSDCPKEARPMINYLNASLPCSCIHYCDSAKTAYILMKSGQGIAILPIFDIHSLQDVFLKELSVNLELEYGIGYLKNNLAQKYVNELLKIAETEVNTQKGQIEKQDGHRHA